MMSQPIDKTQVVTQPRPRTQSATDERAEPLTPPAEVTQAWSVWRLEYALLALIALLVTASAFVFFFFDIDFAQLSTYGYLGLFAVSLISAASIVMPMPGAAAITGAGAVLDPILGIPTPILVGLVAGLAETLGELTGYAAGYAGSGLFRDRSYYDRVQRWMERRGIITMFLLSSFPNPLVDVAGVAAGAVNMRLWRFLAGVFPGKVLKNIYLASGGLVAAELIRRLFA